MTPAQVRAYGQDELDGAGWDQKAREFALGVIAAADGQFHEDRCGPRGTLWESAYCEGGREGVLRLRQGAVRNRRLQHGVIL